MDAEGEFDDSDSNKGSSEESDDGTSEEDERGGQTAEEVQEVDQDFE